MTEDVILPQETVKVSITFFLLLPLIEGASGTLRQNQDFDELKQKNKQLSSSGASTLKLSVFLGRGNPALRISIGSPLLPNPSAAQKFLSNIKG